MKIRTSLLLCGLLYASLSFSQHMDVSKWLTDGTIEGKPVKILRIPPEQAPPHLKMDIGSIQRNLDRNRKWYEEGKPTEESMTTSNIEFIQNRDTSFPVQYYKDELAAFLAYNDVQKERVHTALMEKIKRQEEAERIARLKEGYTWINPDTVWVRSKPDAKSIAIGRLYRLSYVKAYQVEGKPTWAEVEFGNHSGYILKQNLAPTWEDMQPNDEELQELKRGRYYSFDPTAAYKAKLAREAAEEERALKAANAAAQKTYITGPRGGCYYVDSHGNKIYVDKSFCK